MRPMFSTEEELLLFVRSMGLTTNMINRIIKTYNAAGAPPPVIVMEIEAFAVARGIPADAIADAVSDHCPAIR